MSKPQKLDFDKLFRMPTLEEHRAASAQWLSRVRPCFYENWPQALKSLSFKTCLVELSKDEQDALGASFDPQGACEKCAEINALAEKLETELATTGWPTSFCRLSSRSPKDAWTDKFSCSSGIDIINLFSSSERILDDLIEYKYADTACYLLLRQFQDIPKPQEWRCFIRDGKVIGITQYHYFDYFPELANALDATVRCREFLEAEVLPILHVNTVVCDIWLKERPVVIEINPYGLSDPCLLTYEELHQATDCLIRVNTEQTRAP